MSCEVTAQDAQEILEKMRRLHARTLTAAAATRNGERAEVLRLLAANLHKAFYAFEPDFFQHNLVRIIRDWYRAARPTTWMFPGVIPGSHITTDGVWHACKLGAERSGLSKPVTQHSLRHYVSRLTRSGRTRVPSDFLGN
jgi:hypothetical protein